MPEGKGGRGIGASKSSTLSVEMWGSDRVKAASEH